MVRAVVALVLLGACSKKPAPTCADVQTHFEPMYAQYDRFGRTEHLSHALRMGRGGCSKLSDDQRRCIVGAKTFEETYKCVGEVAPGAEPKDFVAVAAAHDTPILVRPFDRATVKFTWTVAALDPKLCKHDAIVPAWCEYKTPEFPNAIFRVLRQPMMDTDDEAEWPVGPYRVTVPGAGVKDKLTKAWGPPRETNGGAYWFNPHTRMRVALRRAQMQGDDPTWVDLEYSGYWPLAEFLGTDKQLFGFEQGKPLIGASAAEVMKRFNPRVDRGRIRMFPIDTQPRDVLIEIAQGLENELPDRVDSFEVNLNGLDTKEVERVLESKFGAPREDRGRLVYREEPRVALDGATLHVGPD